MRSTLYDNDVAAEANHVAHGEARGGKSPAVSGGRPRAIGKAIGKILVGATAGADLDSGLKLAAELATSNDAELVVLHVEPPLDARAVFDPDGDRPRPSPVGRLAREFPGLRVRASEARALPLRALCDVAEDEQPDLIVVAQGRARQRRGFLPKRASSALVERAPCAVVLVAA